jgi:hypothetical protein
MTSWRLTAITVLVLVARGVFAQPLSFVRLDVPTYDGARGLATADFDRNGWPDVAQANTGRDSVTIVLNHIGDGGAPAVFDVPVGHGPFDIVAADFNRDTLPDLAVANADDDSITVLFSRAGGGVASQIALPAPGNPRGITAADMNRDGRPDIIYSSYADGDVRILLGDGTGNFTPAGSFRPVNDHPQGVLVADFNRDGKPDVAVAYTGGAGLGILFGDGAGGFSGGADTNPAQPSINVLASADFNSDGWIDVAAATTATSRLSIYLGGPGGWTYQRSYATGASPRGVTAADLDQDGAIDLVTANHHSNSVSILRGQPGAPGTFAEAFAVDAGAGSRAVVAADFDRDGRIDLATGNQTAAAVTVLGNRTTLAPAAYAFDTVPLPPAAAAANSIQVADFDRDGQLDVLLPGTVVLHTGAVTTLPGSGAGDYAVGDFNRDGITDIVRTQQYGRPQQLQVFLGDGGGGFSESWSVPLNGGVLSAVDADRDGILDLVATGFASGLTVNTFLGNGDGTFRAGTSKALAAVSGGITIGDANGDGNPDVLTARSALGGESWAVIIPGDGHGGFGDAVEYAVPGTYVNTVRVADVNHDGLPDVLTDGIGDISVRLGQPDGGFGAARQFAGTAIPGRFDSTYGFTVADINQDGNLDVVYSSILLGNGDGTFAPAEFDLPWAAKAFADYDHDGTTDIIVSTYDSGEILLNRRTRPNHPPVLAPLQDHTWSYLDMYEGDEDEQCWMCASATDADLHALQYEWRDRSGARLGYGPTPPADALASGEYDLTLIVTDGRGGRATGTAHLTITPFKEVVIDAHAECCGAWTQVPDSSAWGSDRMQHPDAGAPKVVTALENPVNYFDVYFTADPTQTYKLWVRLRAQGDNAANDSIHVQFDGAVDASGTPVYQIGTTSSLAVNLEECSGCGDSGWGWRDERWGPGLNAAPVLLRFPAGGRQHLRIQTREDGVSVDEIVLSSGRYLTSAPGPAKNDTITLQPTTYQY